MRAKQGQKRNEKNCQRYNRRNAATVFETQRSQANAKFAAHFPTGGVDSAGKLVQTWLNMATQRDNVCAYVEDK